MYLALLEGILSIVNCENDLNGNNIVEKIKEQLKKREISTYEESKNESFDINYKFSVYDYYDKKRINIIKCSMSI